jgi:hypothetical protein
VVVALNVWSDTSAPPASLEVGWGLLGLPPDLAMQARDLYAQRVVAEAVTGSLRLSVPPADCVALKLIPNAAPQPALLQTLDAWRPWHMLSDHHDVEPVRDVDTTL